MTTTHGDLNCGGNGAAERSGSRNQKPILKRNAPLRVASQ
jgi:hypothetical protein